MVRSYEVIIRYLTDRGLKPHLQQLDNEFSRVLQLFLAQEEIKLQLAPQHMHRHSMIEGAIKTFKNHFISGLCSVDPNFLLRLWDNLLPHATITLNHLRQSSINPRLCEYDQLNGHYYFNHVSMEPSCTTVISYVKPDQCAIWAPHGMDGWYIGPSLDHYRCYRIHVSDTQSYMIVETVEFFPLCVTIPHTASKDLATITAQ
jgi:hypothetical protein